MNCHNIYKMTLFNESYVEKLFYKSEELINEGEFADAKEVLIELLNEDPTFALAHNALGWIYTHKLLNYEKAETHLKLSIKYGRGVVVGYTNYATLLLETNKYLELREFVDANFEVPGIDKAYFLALKAITFEVETRYYMALKILDEAKTYALNDEFITAIKGDKARINRKMGKFAKLITFF
ncbi:MAG: tetratricopeptide (TPR) repeat protein [Bacteroidia bacterium]|jgi:tetratricopeptide (TPR) repeat protein